MTNFKKHLSLCFMHNKKILVLASTTELTYEPFRGNEEGEINEIKKQTTIWQQRHDQSRNDDARQQEVFANEKSRAAL